MASSSRRAVVVRSGPEQYGGRYRSSEDEAADREKREQAESEAERKVDRRFEKKCIIWGLLNIVPIALIFFNSAYNGAYRTKPVTVAPTMPNTTGTTRPPGAEIISGHNDPAKVFEALKPANRTGRTVEMTPDELEFHEYFIEPCLLQVKNSLRPASQCARNFTANQPVYARLLAREVDPYAKSRLIHQLYQIEDDPKYAAQLADLLYGHSGDWQYGLRFIRYFMDNNTSTRDTTILRLLSKNGRIRGRLLDFLEHHESEIYEKPGQHRGLYRNFYESLVPTATNSDEMMQVHRIRENSPDASLKMAAFWTSRLGQHTLGPWRN